MKHFSKLIVLTLVAALLLCSCAAPASQDASKPANEPETTDVAAPAEGGAVTETPETPETPEKTYKIGFSAFSMAQEWHQNIGAGAQQRADELGIELVVADSNSDTSTQIDAIQNFIVQGVDAIVISPVDSSALSPVVQEALDAGIQVICESTSVNGCATTVSISNYELGESIGAAYAAYAAEEGVEPKILILGYQSLENCRQRVEGFKAGLDSSGISYEILTEVDGGFREVSLTAATDAFTAHPDINCIFGINDDSTLGAVAAVRAAGLNEDEICAILFGLEGIAGRGEMAAGGMCKLALASFPEACGVSCIDACVKALNGETLPEMWNSPAAVITAAEFDSYFIENGDTYSVNYEKLSELY